MQPEPGRRRLPLAAWVLLGAFGVLVLSCGAGVAWLVSSQKGRQFLESARETATVFSEAAQAPGTQELRALGCQQAAVLQSGDLFDSLARFGVEPRAEEPLPPRELRLVLCRNRWRDAEPPGCDAIARTYVAATGATEAFAVAAQKQGAREPHCQGLYAPDGERLGAVPETEG